MLNPELELLPGLLVRKRLGYICNPEGSDPIVRPARMKNILRFAVLPPVHGEVRESNLVKWNLSLSRELGYPPIRA
jgi:hypothetical protein